MTWQRDFDHIEVKSASSTLGIDVDLLEGNAMLVQAAARIKDGSNISVFHQGETSMAFFGDADRKVMFDLLVRFT